MAAATALDLRGIRFQGMPSDRATEKSFVDLCAHIPPDAGLWKQVGDPGFLAGTAVMLAGARWRRLATSTWSASPSETWTRHGVTVLLGDPPHSTAKPRLGQPGFSGSAAPRAPADVFGEVHPATPIRPVVASFERGSMKPG